MDELTSGTTGSVACGGALSSTAQAAPSQPSVEVTGQLAAVSPSTASPTLLREGEKVAVALLSGGNPQIAKGDGDAPVQAYIAAMPGLKRDIGKRLDALIVRNAAGGLRPIAAVPVVARHPVSMQNRTRQGDIAGEHHGRADLSQLVCLPVSIAAKHF